MDEPITPNDVPRDSEMRAAWVRVKLKQRRTPLFDLAAKHGITGTALYNALRMPSERMEKIIADALGLTPEQLFPERFTRDGRRIPTVRRRRSISALQAANG